MPPDVSSAAPGRSPSTSTDRSAQAGGTEAVRAADSLVQAALDFTVELFPAANAHFTYIREDDARLSEEPPSPGDEEKTGRFRDVRAVPDHPNFRRAVTVDVDERISRFLREDAEAHTEAHLEAAYARLKIPVILAHEWTRQIAGRASAETRDALGARLPTHIIAHLIADQYAQVTDRERYRFARHGEPKSAHDRLARTLVETLGYMDVLTRSRVERQDLSHGLVVAPLPGQEEQEDGPSPGAPVFRPLGRYPEDFRTLKRTPLLTDGYQTALWVTPEGRAAHIITRDAVEDIPALLDRDLGPLSFIAAAAEQHEGIGLMLRPGGSVMALAAGQPLFMRHSGTWHGLIWDQVRSTMTARYGDVGAQVFGVALILTTSGKGGILAIVDDPPDGLSLNQNDRVDLARRRTTPTSKEPSSQPSQQQGEQDDDAPAKWLLHQLLPAGNILDLSRPTLALLAGIDGATIVDREGRLLGYGAIVESMQGQSEGARTAAARTLSAHGLVLKVSEDGPVQVFEDGDSVLTV